MPASCWPFARAGRPSRNSGSGALRPRKQKTAAAAAFPDHPKTQRLRPFSRIAKHHTRPPVRRPKDGLRTARATPQDTLPPLIGHPASRGVPAVLPSTAPAINASRRSSGSRRRGSQPLHPHPAFPGDAPPASLVRGVFPVTDFRRRVRCPTLTAAVPPRIRTWFPCSSVRLHRRHPPARLRTATKS